MLKNLKFDYNKRAVVFEELSKVLVRNKRKNNFIFRTNYFETLDEICNKYRFDISSLDKGLLYYLNQMLSNIDLIEFVINNKDERFVEKLIFYEVKTKNNSNTSKFDICASSYNTYSYLKERGFDVKVVSFIIFEDWKFSFNIHDLNLDNFRKYSRYKNK